MARRREVGSLEVDLPESCPAAPVSPIEKIGGLLKKGLKKGETHKERFEDEGERLREARGYLVVLCCNLLSCASLVA